MTTDVDADPIATAAFAAVLAELFPADHPGQVRTIGDDDIPTLAGAPTQSGPELAGFAIYERLGRGSTGEVYRARDDRTGRIVALKFMRAGTEQDAVRLESEARLLVRCTHPNIVHVYQVATHTESRVVLVMEYIDGTTLDVWLASADRRPREILELLGEIGRALEAAHNVGVIHRDIQPTNVMVDTRGRAKLIDFGLANVEKPANGPAPVPTHVSPMVGTYEYIAPEHRDGAGCTSRSDQYSFCVLLFRSLYRHTPPEAPIRALPARPRLNRHARAALLRGLQVDPQRRWPSLDHLLHELARPWWKCRRLAYASFAVLLVGALVAALLQIGGGDDAAVNTCLERVMAGARETRREAEMLGIASELELLIGDPQAVCRAADAPRDEPRIDEVVLCLNTQATAIAGLAALRHDDFSRPDDEPRIRLAWGQQRAPLPPLARCELDRSLATSPAGRAALVQLFQVRLLLQHQQYVAARRLLEDARLLDRLSDLGAVTARAEALLYAAQIARRFAQQNDPIVIKKFGVDDLLDLADAATVRGKRPDLQLFVQLERVHRALDRKDDLDARKRLEGLGPSATEDTPELAIRLLQARARLLAVDDPRGAAELLQDALARAQSTPELVTTSIPVQLRGLMAIYGAKADPAGAHELHAEAVAAAQQNLSTHDYLLAVIAANAARNAFNVGRIDAGEQWGAIGLNALHTPFGVRALPAEQLAYDLASALLLAGESERGLTYVDRALGYARQFGSEQEVAFSLVLRSLLEMRSERLEAARRSATEAVASLPPSFARDPQWRTFFALAELTAEAEGSADPGLAVRLYDLRDRIEHDPSSALPESRIELDILLAQVLARLDRIDDASEVLRGIDGQSQDPLTRGDVHMLHAFIAEKQGDLVTATHHACTARDIYEGLGTDGQRRLETMESDAPHNHRTPSLRLLDNCSQSPDDLVVSSSAPTP
jgi:predicted Ser/Thr protein kinase/tetratricopeptide (TPR) repeat protein